MPLEGLQNLPKEGEYDKTLDIWHWNINGIKSILKKNKLFTDFLE